MLLYTIISKKNAMNFDNDEKAVILYFNRTFTLYIDLTLFYL